MRNIRTKQLLMALLITFMPFLSFAEFKPHKSFTKPGMTIRIGQGSYKPNAEDATATFQKAIEKVNKIGGGHVVVPAGEYSLNGVEMLSNVHIVFESGVKLYLSADKHGNQRGILFEVGREKHVENVSLLAEDKWVDVYLPRKTRSARLVVASDVVNFHFSGFMVHDQRTIHSSLIFVWAGEENGVSRQPKHGLIENIWAMNAHYGYGALQVHAGNDLHFKNILAVGGVACRLETGLPDQNLAAWGKERGYIGLDNITIDNMTNLYGQGALMTQPHTIRHGSVVANDIKAHGSEFAVSANGGFVSRKKYSVKRQKVIDPKELSGGNFESMTIDNIQANFADENIVTRYVHLKYYPKELHNIIRKVDKQAYGEPNYLGRAIAAVYNSQKENATIQITNLKARGYNFQPDVLGPKDLFKGKLDEVSKQEPLKVAPDLPWAKERVTFDQTNYDLGAIDAEENVKISLSNKVRFDGKTNNTIRFQKLFGEDWLSVSEDGIVTGRTPNKGQFSFAVKADKGTEGFDIAFLTIEVK